MRSSLFTGLFVPDELDAATSGRAWLQAMLDAEAALAAAEAEAGIVPTAAAEAIAAAADAERFDVEALGRDARASGTPVVPLVKALSEALPGDAARFVHWGATSQDIMDTAAMLVACRAGELVDAELARVCRACAALAREHRSTPMVGRTLLQQALPITFGLKAAGWLAGAARARERLAAVELPAELGGAAGTLASLGEDGPRVLALYAAELGLAEPELPWHTRRAPIAELGAALGLAAGALEKVALDLTLLAQTEVGEVAEPSGPGRGGSSTMPHKRNPIGAVLAAAGARRARGAATTLADLMAHEHERATGAWHAEWEPLSEALALSGGAAAALAEVLEGLEVKPERMRANLDLTGGLIMAESVTMALAEHVGRPEAKRIVEAAAGRASEPGRSLREELTGDDEVTGAMSTEEIDAALDPAGYLGSAELFVDRALERYGEATR